MPDEHRDDDPNPLSIVYVHAVRMPSPVANAVNVAKSCAAFTALGHRVTLVHFKGAGDIFHEYAPSHAFATVSLRATPETRGAVRLLAWTAALSARLAGAFVYGRAPYLLLPAARLGCPAVLELHAPLAAEARRNLKAFGKLLRSKRLRAIICISQALAERVAQEWPESKDLLFVAHDGADPGPEPDWSNHKHGCRPLLGYAGHLYPGRGIDLIVELARIRPEWDFLLLGGRPEDAAGWRGRTADLPNIQFAGMLPHREVQERLAPCDILLAPYARSVIVSDLKTNTVDWMSPLKLFEYMATGKPLVVSDLPVIHEVVSDGNNARLAAPENVDDWARVIGELVADPHAAREIGKRARSDLVARYSWSRRARAIARAIAR